MRAPFQVLVFPFRRCGTGRYAFCVLKRSDLDVWQGIAGGGRAGELPLEAAVREAHEEGGLSKSSRIFKLDTTASIPRYHFTANPEWDKSLYVVPEYSYAVECEDQSIVLSDEHSEFKWGPFEEVEPLLAWDSNRTALWELHQRLEDGVI